MAYMRKTIVTNTALAIFAVTSFINCANPLNKATYYRHYETGANAEQHGDAELAETAYSSALGNVYIGNLGPEIEAEALFNLGRIERINGKYDESLEHLLKSLYIDENINMANEDFINATLAEIAKTYYMKGQYQQGETYLSRISNVENKEFSSNQARQFLKNLFSDYSKKLNEIGLAEKAEHYSKMAAKLR